jgi:hypothetical protein
MKNILFVLAVSAVVMGVTALADGGCPKTKGCAMAPCCPASTNAPACTNAPAAAQPAK